ncbi:cytochrome C family protein [Anaeromyxobacter sp. Fw109-5]|nr:cytochrome C family protein [Anaeromyxobacter sp. Fw109-5]
MAIRGGRVMKRQVFGIAVSLAAFALSACSARPVAGEEETAVAATCTRCHGGDENSTGAPPRDVHANTSTELRSVGAHTAHVMGTSRISPPLGCDACHVAPPPENPAAHIDGDPGFVPGVLARADGAAAAFHEADASCTVYCHGATLRGGSRTAPVWTTVDGTQATCGSCHGLPPSAPHPQRFDCERCHPDSLTPAGPGAIAPSLHLNGQVELAGGCATCHGNAQRVAPNELAKAAPPTGLNGETATTQRAVGAHEAHVLGGAVAGPMGCDNCHLVPAAADHADGVVDVAFGALASREGVTPVLDKTSPESPSCSSTYCHGATLAGGTLNNPVWTQVNGTANACGACHGAPPPSPHPAGTTCSVCHPGTVRTDGTINLVNGLHVNGTVDVNDYHPAGWVVPTAHGYAANRDLASCKSCHGADLTGGMTGISCDTCHQAGWRTSCTFCHGDGNRAANKAMPPVGTQGELAKTDRAVGAHEAHLVAGKVRGPMQCTECHTVPTDIGHVTGSVDLVWGPLASANGATAPSFTTDLTCASTYCHGGTLAAGGTITAPLWTKVDGTQAACGTCHGNPPPSPHPQMSSCKGCHPETMATDTTLDLAGGKHLDGVLQKTSYHPDGWSNPATHGLAANADLASCKGCHGSDLTGGASGVSCASCHGASWQSNCSFCHGDPARAGTALVKAAPPQGSQNETATSDRAVGAHVKHLTGGALSGGFACAECHAVPASLTHVDGRPALAFGTIANSDGVASTFSGTTCNTYCHGAKLGGGSIPAPAWTTVNGTQAACGACHGLPPPAPHSQNPNCGGCHDGYTQSSVNKTTHVNGRADVKAMTCSSCHGDSARAGSELLKAAPPVGTGGETATTSLAVGAHQVHLQGNALAGPVACNECHAVPTSMGHSDVKVDLAFGTLARTDGAAPTWTRTTATCASTYCHGATLAAGGSKTNPVWTGGASQGACGTCHGAPPPAPHSQNPACGNCHDGYTATTVNLADHIDGGLDLKAMTCSSCHGDSIRAGAELVKAAPPIGAGGETATTSLAVGAHQTHVIGSVLSNGYACSECHVVPATMTHPNATVDVAWGTIATKDGATPSWNRAAATCSSTYCHGAFVGGAPLNAPSWTTVDGSQAVCGSCHGAPPPAPHSRSTNCGSCHPSYPPGGVNRAVHANGQLDLLPMTCASCHGDPSRAGSASLKASPPYGTGGESATTARAVGAHLSHVIGKGVMRALACSECHVEPTSMTHPDGAVVMTWGATAKLHGVIPSWNGATCTNYCHGASLAIGGGSATAPTWTKVDGTQGACGSCHGAPPPAPHPGSPLCGSCHDGYTATTTNPVTHIDGTVDVKALTCTSCHGDSARAGTDTLKSAPPIGTHGETATTQRAVGAHQKHLLGGALSKPIACEECHAVPTSTSHPDSTVQLAWGAKASANGVTPTFNTANATCTNYCHGALSTTGSNKTPSWTGGPSQAACGTCHFSPSAPGAGTFHYIHRGLSCAGGNGQCHPSGYSQTSVNLELHVDGTKQASAVCEACHYYE